MFQFLFSYTHEGKAHQLGIVAESVREAKAHALSISEKLVYVGYEEMPSDPFEGQEIAWICAKPVDELPFPFRQLKQLALLFAFGTNCQCCLGYRIMAGLVLGGVIGYWVG